MFEGLQPNVFSCTAALKACTAWREADGAGELGAGFARVRYPLGLRGLSNQGDIYIYDIRNIAERLMFGMHIEVISRLLEFHSMRRDPRES